MGVICNSDAGRWVLALIAKHKTRRHHVVCMYYVVGRRINIYNNVAVNIINNNSDAITLSYDDEFCHCIIRECPLFFVGGTSIHRSQQ